MHAFEVPSAYCGSPEANAEHSINERPKFDDSRVILVVCGDYSPHHSLTIERLCKRVGPLGYGVLCVTGLEAASGFPTNKVPSIYQVAAQLNVAGTIVLASSLGRGAYRGRVFNIVDHFKHRRLVAIDLEGDSWSSVVHENAPAMRALVLHLLDTTAGDDIAFLSGSKGGSKSIELEKVFRDGMAERGRQVDESLILYAGFEASNAYQIIDELLSSGRCPNAVVAATDAMACGAIDALEHHGINVPDDVSVAVFDDSEHVRGESGPISTERAYPERQMDFAADELLRLIVAGDAPEFKTLCLPAQLASRGSTTVPFVDVLLSESLEFSEPINSAVQVDMFLSELPEPDRSMHHGSEASTAMARELAIRNHTDYLTSHEIRERLHVRLARCSNRESVYRAFDEGMQDLSIKRAFLVSFDWASNGKLQSASLLHAWPNFKFSDACKNYLPERLLPPGLEQELGRGALFMCGVEIDGQSAGALLYEQIGQRCSMDSLAQTTFAALRRFDQCDSLEQQTYELACVNDELVRQANLDPLTGLANRSRLLAELENSLDLGADGIVIVFLDLDGFKPVNDTLGHAAGDRVLRKIGHRLDACLRECDVVARFGGDEFVVLLRNMHSADDIKRITQQFISAVSRSIYLSPDQPISLTASVGIACNPKHNRASNELLQRADTAMYRAKRLGGNGIAWFSEALSQEVDEQLRVEQALHEGLNKGRFSLVYQPRVDLLSGSIISAEALLRWRQADGTDVSPALFIKIAEQSGLIARLDAFAFRTACAVAADWYHRGIECRMSVNLSVARLQQYGLVDEIKSILLQHDLPPDRLELEVTETAAMTDIDANINTLQTLRAMGLRLSIDDFGSEYSSLSYLRNLPIDCVKIDRLFLSTIVNSDATENPDAQIMRAIIALGKGLGLTVVAEGVETKEQLNFLVNCGCDEAQGFLISRPLELDAIETMLLTDSEKESWQVDGKKKKNPKVKIVGVDIKKTTEKHVD